MNKIVFAEKPQKLLSDKKLNIHYPEEKDAEYVYVEVSCPACSGGNYGRFCYICNNYGKIMKPKNALVVLIPEPEQNFNVCSDTSGSIEYSVGREKTKFVIYSNTSGKWEEKI